MTAYTPTVIGAGPLDGSVIDGNFDKFQTATGKLDGTNFANTDDLGFRNIHTGSVTETFVENGNPVVAIYNAFSDNTVGGTDKPYPRTALLPEINVVHDTEVCFVAKSDGEAFVVSSAALSRPKCHWVVAATSRTIVNVIATLRMSEGLPMNPGTGTAIGQTDYTWTFGHTTSERVGQVVRVCGHHAVTAVKRYSFWLELYFTSDTVLATGAPGLDPWPLGSSTVPTYFPEYASAVSLYGSSRQTVATCKYK